RRSSGDSKEIVCLLVKVPGQMHLPLVMSLMPGQHQDRVTDRPLRPPGTRDSSIQLRRPQRRNIRPKRLETACQRLTDLIHGGYQFIGWHRASSKIMQKAFIRLAPTKDYIEVF